MDALAKKLAADTRRKVEILATDLTDSNDLSGVERTSARTLPGATATDLGTKAGRPVELLPAEIVMPAEDMVDAALSGLDQGEFVTIPALPDVGQWQTYEAARQALLPNLSRAKPAARYENVHIAE